MSASIALRKNVRRHVMSGFTLIELLLVMMIIAILAAIVVPKFTGRIEDAKIKATKGDISNMKSMLAVYEVDNGQLPTTEEGLAALQANPGNLPGWKRLLDKDGPIVDQWGTPYSYTRPGTNGKEFDLVSAGPDKQLGTSDDITDQTP